MTIQEAQRSASAAPAADPRKVRSTNIRVTHLTLRTSKEMKQRIGTQLQVLKGRNGSTLRISDAADVLVNADR